MTTIDEPRWATLAEARRDWADAKGLSDETLSELLEVATVAARAFAPALPDSATVPAHYRAGVILHARDTWGAQTRNISSDTTIGLGEYAVRVRALSDVVKSLLRPRRAVPVLG